MAQTANERLRDVKEDFSNNAATLPEHLRGEVEAIKRRLREQLQAEIREDRAKIAREWERLRELQAQAGQKVQAASEGARENLRDRFESVSVPPQLAAIPNYMAAVKQDLERALGNVHLPPAAAAHLEAKIADLVNGMAAEKAALAAQLEKLKESHAALVAAAAAAAAAGSGAAALGKARALFSGGGSTTVAAAGDGSAANVPAGAGPLKAHPSSQLAKSIAAVRSAAPFPAAPCTAPTAAGACVRANHSTVQCSALHCSRRSRLGCRPWRRRASRWRERLSGTRTDSRWSRNSATGCAPGTITPASRSALVKSIARRPLR